MKAIFETKKDDLSVSIYQTNQEMGMAAAEEAAAVIRKAIQDNGQANIIIATGNSQLTFLEALSSREDVDWSRTNIFHMDEYVGIPADHPASFPLFLHRHIIDKVKPWNFYPIVGQTKDPQETCRRYEQKLRENPADLCALGIGENGHLAFNDPPLARFDEPKWVHVVRLTDSCKRQQVGEGHFKSIEDVPNEAISLSIPALLAAKHVLAIVPEQRKADIVAQTLTGPIGPLCPASILRQTVQAQLYLDADSGAKVRA
jgi:glucosamine-6-phosphate deaminase